MKNKELKIGILAIIAGVTLYFGFNFLKGEDFFSTTNKYSVYYDNVDGLTISNPVIVNGFSVGRVKSMKLIEKDNKRQIHVILDVRDDIPVGDSTIAVLTSSDFLGGKAIVLELGASSTLFQTGDVVNGTIEKSITDELNERIRPVLATVDTTLNKVNSLIDNDDKQSIKSTLKHIEMSSLLIEKMAAENRKTFNDVGFQIKGIMASFAETEKRIAPLLDKAGVFTDSLNTLQMATALRDVQSAIANMNAILVKVNSTDGTFGMLMNDKTLYNSVGNSLKNLDSLINHMNEHPNHFMAPLGKTKKQIDKEARKAAKRK